MESSEHFTILENKSIGRNIARHRKFKDKIALEVADYLGISESAYTRYERGESKITIELIQKIAEYLNMDPLQLLAPQSGHIVENVSYSPFAINGTVNANDETLNATVIKLVENVISMNERILRLLEERK